MKPIMIIKFNCQTKCCIGGPVGWSAKGKAFPVWTEIATLSWPGLHYHSRSQTLQGNHSDGEEMQTLVICSIRNIIKLHSLCRIRFSYIFYELVSSKLPSLIYKLTNQKNVLKSSRDVTWLSMLTLSLYAEYLLLNLHNLVQEVSYSELVLEEQDITPFICLYPPHPETYTTSIFLTPARSPRRSLVFCSVESSSGTMSVTMATNSSSIP